MKILIVQLNLVLMLLTLDALTGLSDRLDVWRKRHRPPLRPARAADRAAQP